ncbi:MAG: ABC transporter ATP-binding protein [Burkholderiaceae bacterium]|nr:ABC transporter ATP-binding protein [Burkholderiaceae bacterium]
MSSAVLLSVDSVSRSFRGLSVLRNVSFQVPAGGITGLIGPNGAGKSTLFNIVSGFLNPGSGRLVYDAKDITRWSVTRRSRAGLVRTFQTPQLFAHMSVRENLMAAGYRSTTSGFISDLFAVPGARRDRQRMAAIAEAACERFELQAVWNRRAGDLPAGRQRLVELARAVVTSPRLVCLDEPSSGLNVDEVAALRAALEGLEASGTAILLVSHDMDLVSVASRVNVLCFGEIIAAGPFDEVKVDARVREAYLGV